jgi:hypothetical protein
LQVAWAREKTTFIETCGNVLNSFFGIYFHQNVVLSIDLTYLGSREDCNEALCIQTVSHVCKSRSDLVKIYFRILTRSRNSHLVIFKRDKSIEYFYPLMFCVVYFMCFT